MALAIGNGTICGPFHAERAPNLVTVGNMVCVLVEIGNANVKGMKIFLYCFLSLSCK